MKNCQFYRKTKIEILIIFEGFYLYQSNTTEGRGNFLFTNNTVFFHIEFLKTLNTHKKTTHLTAKE
jgi:hypothetical protein